MLPATQELVNKFQRELEVYFDARDLEYYWVITARIPHEKETLHHVHYARKFVTSRNENGSVLIFVDPDVADAYTVESWGEMETFDDFVKKALVRIRENRAAADEGAAGDCGTSCS